MSQPPHLTRRHRPADEVALYVEATRGVRQVGVVVVPAPGRARRPDGVRPLPLAESNNHSPVVIWAGEFGRLPVSQPGAKPGRDHNPHANTAWLAGGGVRGGVSYGETDAFGYKAVVNKADTHDFHATILHLLGLDHERLTYLHNGRRFRLTDVAGRVIKEVLARPERESLACRHVPRTRFVPGQPLEIELSLETPASSVSLYYRHVNQAERFNLAAMERREHNYRVTIPAKYSNSGYHLEYYFEVKSTTGKTLLYPGFGKDLTNQPYFVIRPFHNPSSLRV